MSADWIALVRPPASELAAGERTFVAPGPLDHDAARAEHAAYCDALRALEVDVRVLASLPGHPDACFVEDPAVALDEVAVLARMGAASRAGEVPALAAELEKLRPLVRLPAGTLEGGDVLVVEDVLYTGLSTRTDHAGMRALAHAVLEHGYRVKAVEVRSGALHLETAVTWLGQDVLLANPRWVDLERFKGLRVVEVHPDEPFGANVLKVGERLIVSDAYPRTLERVVAAGFGATPVRLDTLHGAEAGPSCLAQLLRAREPG